MSNSWKVSIRNTIEAPIAEIIDNYLDFEHGQFLHKDRYAYTHLLHSAGNAHFIEYGIKQFFITITTTGWFQYVPPARFVSHTKGLFGTTDILIVTSVSEESGITTIDVVYTIRPPALLRPLRRLIERSVRRWNARLWEEDKALILRRTMLLKLGFRDNVGLPEPRLTSRAG